MAGFNKNTDMKEYVHDLFKRVGQLYNIDIEQIIIDNPKQRSGTFELFHNQDSLFSIYKSYVEMDYDIAYIKLIDMLRTYLMSATSLSYDFTVDTLYKNINLINECLKYIKQFDEWNVVDKQKFNEYLSSNSLLTDADKTPENFEKISRLQHASCKDVIHNSKLLKSYVFKQGNAVLNPNEHYHYVISDTFIATSDVPEMLDNLRTYTDDLIHYRLFVNIEKILDYTNFVIVIQYKDTIYISTDAIEFENPRTASSSRKPSRRREDYWSNLNLPYNIIDDIITWRGKQTAVVTNSPNDYELYILKLSEYLKFDEKVFCGFLFDILTSEISINLQQVKQISMFENLLNNQLLLEDKNISSITINEKEIFANINFDQSKEYIESMIIDNKTTEIATISNVIKSNSSYNPHQLLTQEAFNTQVAWFTKEHERQTKQDILNKLYANASEDNNKLKILLGNSLERIYQIILSGKHVSFIDPNKKDVSQFGRSAKNSYIITDLCNSTANSWLITKIIIDNTFDQNPKAKSHYECVNCNKESKISVTFRISHYNQLCMLLNCERSELPVTFQNYTSHIFIPYTGNSILNNINPEFLLYDPRSNNFTNGFSISIVLCKSCINKLFKKYKRFENSIVINNNNKFIDIINYDEWIKDTEHSSYHHQRYI